jgi:hypothetical protein
MPKLKKESIFFKKNNKINKKSNFYVSFKASKKEKAAQIKYIFLCII